MNRGFALGFIVVAGACSMAVAAYQQPAATEKEVEVEKLKDNLFVLRGGGGNTAVFVQTGGVTVVDTKNPGWGQPILDKIKELTNKPVTTIINTHTHGDHVSGNVEFPETVEIVTHENTRANMERMAAQGGPNSKPNVFQTSPGRGMPRRVFTDRLTLGSGPDRVDLYYFGRGHTNGDAFVVFPSLRVMHAGDMFPGKRLPFIDGGSGGSGVEYASTLMKVHSGAGQIDTIITGHSTQMTLADLREFAEFVRAYVDSVQQAKKAGQTVEQVAETWKVPAQYAGYGTAQPSMMRGNIETIFAETK